MNNVIETILARRSTRGFSETPLTQAETDLLTQVALASPTARNTQSWHFSIVTNQALLDRFNQDMNAYMAAKFPAGQRGRFEENGYHVFYHAPLVVVISTPSDDSANKFAQIDCGIAVENLAIAAQSLGLGSVIVGLPRDLFNAPQSEGYRRDFGLPEGHEFAIAICIGHNTVTKEAHPIADGKIDFIS